MFIPFLCPFCSNRNEMDMPVVLNICLTKTEHKLSTDIYSTCKMTYCNWQFFFVCFHDEPACSHPPTYFREIVGICCVQGIMRGSIRWYDCDRIYDHPLPLASCSRPVVTEGTTEGALHLQLVTLTRESGKVI